MMKMTWWIMVLLAGCASVPERVTSTRIRFDAKDAGQLPPGFSTALTGGGPVVSWKVRPMPGAPESGAALIQESRDETSYRFPMCIDETITARDVSVQVKFRSVSGSVDQAGGIVLRYRPENYYIARANALEDNVNLFKTIHGNRIKIAEVELKVTPGEWHTLGFSAIGSELIVTFDGKKVIDTHDKTFRGPGKVGLWTKADSVSAFADLQIQTGARPGREP